jgi:hypothetical protein
MDVLITDVTEMGGANYCVAGWDIAAKRMVRPCRTGVTGRPHYSISTASRQASWSG